MVETMHAEETTTKKLKEQTKKVKEDLRELGSIGREASTEQLGKAKVSTARFMEKGKEKAIKFEHKVEDYVKAKPFKSLMVAMGTGALIGFLLRRR